jgi:glycosyltransferase involved in cell wall biosynthesis
MRIAQIATLGTPVRATRCGSIEGLVWLLTRELVRLDHQVTVFAAPESETDGEVVTSLPGTYGRNGAPADWTICELMNLCRAVAESGRFDLLHSHSYLNGLPLQQLTRTPMLHTLHTFPGQQEADLWSLVPDAAITAISKAQWSQFAPLAPAAVIHHGVDPEQHEFRASPDDYVCYLGRFTRAKGVLGAIEVARTLGMRLKLAGPRSRYYDQHVAASVDGEAVDYVGYVSGAAKAQLLGGARALLYPIEVAEPFGLVLIEAMMCGTPVVARRIGAVPEIVDEGMTGYCADSLDDLARQVTRAVRLDRSRVRARAELRFSGSRMGRDYARVYESVLASQRREGQT